MVAQFLLETPPRNHPRRRLRYATRLPRPAKATRHGAERRANPTPKQAKADRTLKNGQVPANRHLSTRAVQAGRPSAIDQPAMLALSTLTANAVTAIDKPYAVEG